jgi:hypothetical protein
MAILGLEVVRAALESNIWASLLGAGVTPQQIVADNTTETPPPLPYVVVSVSFDGLVADGLGGCPADAITGALNVTAYTAKQIGAGPGEAVALAVVRGLNELTAGKWGGVGVKVTPLNIEGPRSMSANNNFDRTRNAHATVVMASFAASVE